MIISPISNFVSPAQGTGLPDFASDNFNYGILNTPFTAVYPTGSEDFVWTPVQDVGVYVVPVIKAAAGASSYTYFQQEISVSRTGTFDFQVEMYKYASNTASDLRLIVLDEDENIIAQVGVYDAWASSSYKEFGISYNSANVPTSYYSGYLSSNFQKYVRVWRDSSSNVHTSIGGVELTSANNVNPIKYVRLQYFNYWPHSYDSELVGRNDRFWFDNFVYSHSLPQSFTSDSFTGNIGTFWEETYPTGSEDFDWMVSSNHVIPKILSLASGISYTYLQQTITNSLSGPFQIQVDAYKYASNTASDMRLEVLNSDFEVIAEVGIYDAWASSSYKIIGNVWDNNRVADTYTSSVYSSNFDGTLYVSRSIGNTLSVNIGGADLSSISNSEGIKAIRLRYHNYWPHSYDSELVGSTTTFWFDNFVFATEVPPTAILFSGYEWDVNAYDVSTTNNEYYDYRDTVHVQKQLNYYSRIEKEFTDYYNTPLEATISLKANVLSTQGHPFAPSLIIDYDSNQLTRLSLETSAISWEYNGVSNYISHSTALYSWYDLRIRIKYNVDISGYGVEYLYKLSDSNSWISLATIPLLGSSIGNPTIAIGTPSTTGNSNNGGVQNYYFANFQVNTLYDQDFDGASDLEEYFYSSNLKINDPDTDGDGLLDGEELSLKEEDRIYTILTIDGANSISNDIWSGYRPPGMLGDGAYFSNPLVADTDGDGLNDLQEKIKGSSPNTDDTDGDGVDDPFDSQPTVVDNFGPSFVNLHGRTFTFGDGEPFTPLESVEGEGIYFFAKLKNDKLYVIMDLYDDRGLDRIEFHAKGFWPGQEFTESETLNGVQSHLYMSYRDASNMLDWDIDIRSKDVDGNWNDKIAFTVEGSVSGFFRDVGDFLTGSLSWIAENLGGFLSWAYDQVTQVLTAALTWIQEQATKALDFFETKINALTKPISDAMSKIIINFVSSIFSYQTGDLTNIYNSIMSPLESHFQPIFDFLGQYETQIDWAQNALDLYVQWTSPVGLALIALNAFADSSLASDFEIITTLFNGGENLGSLAVNALETVFGNLGFDYSIGGISMSELPPQVNIEAMFNDLYLLGVDPDLTNLIGGILGALSGFGPVSQSLSLNSFNFNNPAAVAVAIGAVVMAFIYILFDHSPEGFKKVGLFFLNIIFAIAGLLLSTSDIDFFRWGGKVISFVAVAGGLAQVMLSNSSSKVLGILSLLVSTAALIS